MKLSKLIKQNKFLGDFEYIKYIYNITYYNKPIILTNMKIKTLSRIFLYYHKIKIPLIEIGKPTILTTGEVYYSNINIMIEDIIHYIYGYPIFPNIVKYDKLPGLNTCNDHTCIRCSRMKYANKFYCSNCIKSMKNMSKQ